VTLGIVCGLVVGKTVGVLGSTWLVQRFSRAQLAEGVSWWDVLGLSMLAGIGFTVALLIGELAFGTGTERDDHVKIGVLLGSLISALLATVVLRARNRYYRRMCAEEERDTDADGVPDVYEVDDARE
jgi:NhaA family Na+:H+ antiporter